MIENQEIRVNKYGFIYNNIIYCWNKKELYKMPYSKNLRYYSKKKLKQQKVGNSIGYWISGTFKSMKNLKEITNKINYIETFSINSDLPF